MHFEQKETKGTKNSKGTERFQLEFSSVTSVSLCFKSSAVRSCQGR